MVGHKRRLAMEKLPNVLLLGNGINRAFSGGVSWDKLLSILSEGTYPE